MPGHVGGRRPKMTGKYLMVAGSALLVFCVLSVPLVADFYEEFFDNHYWQDPNDEPWDDDLGAWPWFNTPPYDPNHWDIDNPHWMIAGMIGQNFDAQAGDGWLRPSQQCLCPSPYAVLVGPLLCRP